MAACAALALLSAAGCGPESAYTYLIEPGDPPRLFVELSITGAMPGEHRLLIPEALPLAPGIPELYRGLSAADTLGRPVPLEYEGAVSPKWINVDMASWRVRIPLDGRLRVRAELLEDTDPARAMGFPKTNQLRRDWAQWSGGASCIVLDAAGRRGATARFRFDTPEGWPVYCAAPRRDGWHVLPLEDMLQTLAFMGGYSRRVHREGDARLTLLANPPMAAAAPDALERAGRDTARVLAHALAIYGAPPEPGRPLSVTAALQRDERHADGRGGYVGVAFPGRLLNIASNDLDSLTDVTVHECLHFYNGHAFSPRAEPPYAIVSAEIWVLEGINEYTTHKWQRDAGVITEDEFLRRLAGFEEDYRASPLRNAVNLPQAATLLYESLTRGDESAGEAGRPLVYAKGALVGFLLDRRVLELTDGSRSIDDALALLFQRFNRYEGKPFYTSADVLGILAELTGADLAPDYERWVLGTDDLELPPLPRTSAMPRAARADARRVPFTPALRAPTYP